MEEVRDLAFTRKPPQAVPPGTLAGDHAREPESPGASAGDTRASRESH